MNWVSAVVLYIVIWWLALFVVLPFGTSPVADPDPTSGWRGAPERPMLIRKMIATTALAAVIWLLIYLVVISGWFSFRTGILAS